MIFLKWPSMSYLHFSILKSKDKDLYRVFDTLPNIKGVKIVTFDSYTFENLVVITRKNKVFPKNKQMLFKSAPNLIAISWFLQVNDFQKDPFVYHFSEKFERKSYTTVLLCREKQTNFSLKCEPKVLSENYIVAVQSQWIVGLKRVDFNSQWLQAEPKKPSRDKLLWEDTRNMVL